MPEEDIKCRIISFRVSDQDYETVEEASRRSGFRSVSLFARSATLACNSSDVVHSPLDVEINRLWRRIEVLTTTLEQIAAHQNVAPVSSITGIELFGQSQHLASPEAS